MDLFDDRAFALTDMAVKKNPLVAGKAYRLFEGFTIAVDRLTGRDRNLPHRKARGIVKRVDGPFAIADEFIRAFQHFVRDRAAFGLG